MLPKGRLEGGRCSLMEDWGRDRCSLMEDGGVDAP